MRPLQVVACRARGARAVVKRERNPAKRRRRRRDAKRSPDTICLSSPLLQLTNTNPKKQDAHERAALAGSAPRLASLLADGANAGARAVHEAQGALAAEAALLSRELSRLGAQLPAWAAAAGRLREALKHAGDVAHSAQRVAIETRALEAVLREDAEEAEGRKAAAAPAAPAAGAAGAAAAAAVAKPRERRRQGEGETDNRDDEAQVAPR